MRTFDIEALLHFQPPEYLCERCLALLSVGERDGATVRCPACGVAYLPTDEMPSCARYLAARGLHVGLRDPFAQARRLARVAQQVRALDASYPPMRALLEAVSAAERFVHFTTFGISAMLLGALKLAAMRVDVRGVVSGVKRDELYREMTAFHNESPRLLTRIYPQDAHWFPHQKIIVVDGLLAFKGSANMTDFGWRKAAQGREVIEVVTNVGEVIDLHNRFFSPAWANFEPNGADGGRIWMQDAYGAAE